MFGTLSGEVEVNAPARQAWELYSTLGLARLAEKDSDDIEKIEVVEGDGGVGTILKLTFYPGLGLTFYKEKFTVIDDEKMVKEAEVVEGGYLELGFTLYRVRFEIIEKAPESCVTKATVEYEVKEEAAANASFVTMGPIMKIMNAAATHLVSNKPVAQPN